MLDAANDDEDRIPDDEALPMLVFAIENYIDVVQRKLLADGLSSDRDRIRERLLSSEMRHLLIPKSDPDA